MPVTCSGNKIRLILTLTGEIDHHNTKTIMQEIVRNLETHLPKTLVLDLQGVTFMDSSGIAVLLRTYRQASQLGTALEVCNVPAQAEKVLHTAGVDKLMHFSKAQTLTHR
ncbi:MAG: STAS domain-containing protein [Oscillospiraceae bacterium]|nr:STAS domain-containing protein [Oscillospiraceae bacterium]